MKITKNLIAVLLVIAFICLYSACKTAVPALGMIGIGIVCVSALAIALIPKMK